MQKITLEAIDPYGFIVDFRPENKTVVFNGWLL
jgi:hypothetical protein